MNVRFYIGDEIPFTTKAKGVLCVGDTQLIKGITCSNNTITVHCNNELKRIDKDRGYIWMLDDEHAHNPEPYTVSNINKSKIAWKKSKEAQR